MAELPTLVQVPVLAINSLHGSANGGGWNIRINDYIGKNNLKTEWNRA